jgi:hypothetical protein
MVVAPVTPALAIFQPVRSAHMHEHNAKARQLAGFFAAASSTLSAWCAPLFNLAD